jgi:hypothetical protein
LHDLLRANVREHIQHGAFEFLWLVIIIIL